MPPEAIRQTLHELRVHQIELEMQNNVLLRAQAELDAANARYFDFYDLAPVGYFTLSEKRLIMEANLTATALLDVVRSDLFQPFSRYILKEDGNSFYLHRKRLFEKAAPQLWEMRMLKKDRTTFWAQIETIVTKDTGGAPTCRIVMRNITERKRAEEALKESENRYRSLVGNASDMVYRTDENGFFTFINPAVTHITGYEADDIIGKHYKMLVLPDTFKEAITFFANQLIKKIPNTYYVHTVRRSETIRVTGTMWRNI